MNGVLTRIENLRELKGLSQAQFCDEVGINTSTYCTYKRRDAIPGTEILMRMADVLNCSTDYLLKGEDYYIDPQVAILAQEMKDNPELQVLLDATRKLSPEGIKSLSTFIEQLKKG